MSLALFFAPILRWRVEGVKFTKLRRAGGIWGGRVSGFGYRVSGFGFRVSALSCGAAVLWWVVGLGSRSLGCRGAGVLV